MNTNKTELTYFEPSYFQRLRTMVQGLKMPRNSREYKAAMIELQRLSAPLSAILMPALLISLMVVLGTGGAEVDRGFVTTIIEIEDPKILEEPEKPEQKPEPREDIDPDFKYDPDIPTTMPDNQVTPYSPQPAPFDSVVNVISPVILKNLFTSGLTGVRGSPTGGGIGGSDKKTEASVMLALRWLKLKQNDDGSWSNNRIAMTGLAILTFLAHGETPDSEKATSGAEFAETVRKGLEYLISKQRDDGRFEGMDGNQYAHPIATYALCEAYGMTANPNAKRVAENALVPIIKGQHPTGGWDYKMNPGPGEDGKYRDDTSYMGWCAQALKAAKLANIPADGLNHAIALAIKGFESNAAAAGGFGYTDTKPTGLTSVGTLCMQLLGAADKRAAKLGLDYMKNWKPSFDEKADGQGDSLQYYHYYATQAKFHNMGGDKVGWEKWNTEMKSLYTSAQKIQKNAIKDMNGKDCDVGWWENKDKHTDRPVMDTCLTALQLMVYYRYLPTTKETAVAVIEELQNPSSDKEEIIINPVEI